jgi:hypothetical protein
MRALAWRVGFVLWLGLMFSSSPAAAAKKPEDVFGGRIMVSDKPYPLEAKSANAYIQTVKKQSKDRFQEDKEKTQWKIYYAAFFKKPVNDLEIKTTLYDITDGNQRFIDSWEEYLNDRGQRVVIGNLKLKRQDGKVNPNSKIMLVMESGGKIVASTQFYILGEGKKYTGKVEFSDEETKAAPADGDPDAEAAKKAEENKDEAKPPPVKKNKSK